MIYAECVSLLHLLMLAYLWVISLLLSLSFLGSCAVSEVPTSVTSRPVSEVLVTESSDQNSGQASPADAEDLPAVVATRVKSKLSHALGSTSPKIESYSRETWSDGCLGLGGPAESCLAALTEGWQVEVVDPATNRRYIYRTNLNGDHIRRSTLDEG